jgi:hypothetical protein
MTTEFKPKITYRMAGMYIDKIADTPFNQRYNWCLENFGPGLEYPPRWESGELGNPLKFRFRDPYDEILFLLRWA